MGQCCSFYSSTKNCNR